jgi:parallel beta-helix repeat protein
LRVRAVLRFALPLIIGLTATLIGPGEAHARIKCGSFLGPGGHYVLDRDLSCPSNPHGAALNLFGGATLNLRGHTVTCERVTPPSGIAPRGIVVRDSTVKNGTVRNCYQGVLTIGSVVKDMILDGNESGVHIAADLSDIGYPPTFPYGDSFVIGNTAMNNGVGFSLRRSTGDVLIENTAHDNLAGFIVRTERLPGPVLLRNTAVRNGTGFSIVGPNRIIANQARKNETGFIIFYTSHHDGEIQGNVAKRNTSDGFFLFFNDFRTDVLNWTRDNIANRNGGNGFLINATRASNYVSGPHLGTLTDNHARGNTGSGIRIGPEGPGPLATATITGNTAIGNAGGDLADDTECRWASWQDNVFETASHTCID